MTHECDLLMESFVKDMEFSDNELSESIFSTVDNYIDDLCIKELDSEDSIFESDRDEADTPFNYIVDRVIEKINGDIINQSMDNMAESIASDLISQKTNLTDPDYCDDINFNEITPEDFQLFINNPNLDRDEECDYNYDELDYNSSDYDSIFNA